MIEHAVGTAPNVDLREADDRTPFDDADEYRVIVAHCCTCKEHETILAEPGRTHEWEHSRRNPRHTVEYHREDNG